MLHSCSWSLSSWVAKAIPDDLEVKKLLYPRPARPVVNHAPAPDPMPAPKRVFLCTLQSVQMDKEIARAIAQALALEVINVKDSWAELSGEKAEERVGTTVNGGQYILLAQLP